MGPVAECHQPPGLHKPYPQPGRNQRYISKAYPGPNSYDPCGPGNKPPLKVNTKYYWRVNEVGGTGIAGDIWNFTTERGIASNPDPANDEVGVSDALATVQWTPYKHSLSSVGGQVFYFSSDFNDVNDGVGGVLIDGNDTSRNVTVAKSTMYYWRVDTNNGVLGFSRGDIWYFTTVFELNVCEDFESTWDYFDTGNLAGTIWDGLIGEAFLLVLDHNNGLLYMKVSSACDWGGANNGLSV